MDKNHHTELFGLGPERMELGIRQLLAIDAAADQRTAQSEPLDPILELLCRDIRMLYGDGGQANEAVRLRPTYLGELLILQLDDLIGEVGLSLGPKVRIDAERFYVDALLTHYPDALRRDH